MRGVMMCFIAIAALFAGCKEDQIAEPSDGREYFPLELNSEREYRVDSIIFDDVPGGNSLDTVSGFILERVTGSFENNLGDSVYTLERMFRRTQTEPWSLTDIWVTGEIDDLAYRTVENIQLVKLRFPLRSDSEWLPTMFSGDDIQVPVGTETITMFTNWDGKVLQTGLSVDVGGSIYNEVIEVQQADDDNDIERRYVVEHYAPGVGLIARTDTILDSRCKRIGNLAPCLEDVGGMLVNKPWIEIGEKGYIQRLELIRYN